MTCHSFSLSFFFFLFPISLICIFMWLPLRFGSYWFLCICWALSFLLVPNTCDSVAIQLSPGKLPNPTRLTLKCHFKGALRGTSGDDSHLHIEGLKLSSLKGKFD